MSIPIITVILSSYDIQTDSYKTVAILICCDVLLSQTQNLVLNFKASITSFFCSFLTTIAINYTFMNYNGTALQNHRFYTCEPRSLESLECSCMLIVGEAILTHTINCAHHLMDACFSPLRVISIWAY